MNRIGISLSGLLLALFSWGQCPGSQADFEDGGVFSGDCDMSAWGDLTITGLNTVTWLSGNATIGGSLTVDAGSALVVNLDATIKVDVEVQSNGVSTVLGIVNSCGDFDVGAAGSLLGTGYITFAGTNDFSGTINTNFSNCSSNACGDISLPVELLDFTAEYLGGKVELAWTTATETNNAHFLVQRSSDGAVFKDISKIESQAIGGNSSNRLDYKFIDRSPLYSTSYYRLKQTDLDGTSETFALKFIDTDGGLNVRPEVFPNPAKDFATIRLNGLADELEIVLLSVEGKLLGSRHYTNANESVSFNFPSTKRKGAHILRIRSRLGQQVRETEQLLVIN